MQRVSEAEVQVAGESIARINAGLLILLGIAADDSDTQVEWMVEKVSRLRIFASDTAGMDRSILDTGGEILLVSQFTLYADTSKGRRPSFNGACPPDRAEVVYESVIEAMKLAGVPTVGGRFGADMKVGLVNDGPVTIILDTPGQV